MNKLLLILTVFFAFTFFAVAAEISESDTGTYQLIDRAGIPKDMFYRLSKENDQWVMEGKKPDGDWENISCDDGCQYRTTSAEEITSYFPTDWQANSDIACIQNIAQAFCRYTAKSNSGLLGYVIVGLVTKRPIPLFIKRVQ